MTAAEVLRSIAVSTQRLFMSVSRRHFTSVRYSARMGFLSPDLVHSIRCRVAFGTVSRSRWYSTLVWITNLICSQHHCRRHSNTLSLVTTATTGVPAVVSMPAFVQKRRMKLKLRRLFSRRRVKSAETRVSSTATWWQQLTSYRRTWRACGLSSILNSFDLFFRKMNVQTRALSSVVFV